MIQQADILTAVKARWDRDGTLVELVPGGLHHGLPEGDREPYARIMLEESDPEMNSGRYYTQEYLAEVSVWSTAGPVNSAGIADAIDRLFDWQRPAAFLLPPPGRVMGLRPAPGQLEIPVETRQAKDVLVLYRRYTVMVQGER